MVGDPVPVATWTSVDTSNTYITATSQGWSGTAPVCNITEMDCKSLWDNETGKGQNYTLPYPSVLDGCEEKPEWETCGRCRIFAPEVELIYFPHVKNTTIDLCYANNKTTCPFGPTTAPFTSANPYDAANCAYGTNTSHPTVTDGRNPPFRCNFSGAQADK